ncbi:hypothetical protein Tco_1041718, partial [Tanacetum coccineum]
MIGNGRLLYDILGVNGNEVTTVEGGGEGENEVMRWWRDGDEDGGGVERRLTPEFWPKSGR